MFSLVGALVGTVALVGLRWLVCWWLRWYVTGQVLLVGALFGGPPVLVGVLVGVLARCSGIRDVAAESGMRQRKQGCGSGIRDGQRKWGRYGGAMVGALVGALAALRRF